MNNDGAADLVTRDPSTGDVRVGLTDGASTFAAPTHFATFPTDHDFNLADLNGDGEADVVGRSLVGDVSSTLSNVTTSFTALPDYVPDPAAPPESTDNTLRSAPAPGGGSGSGGPAPSGGPGGSPQAGCPGGASTGLTVLPPPKKRKNMTLAFSDDGQVEGDCGHFLQTVGRAGEAGQREVRIFVLWSRYQDTGSLGMVYRSALDAAVNHATAAGLTVYMTLTGADYDQPNASNNFVDDGTGTYNGNSTNPDRGKQFTVTNYGDFVGSAVKHFAPMGVQNYSMWNEPNLTKRQSDTFLNVTCSNSTMKFRRDTTDLYNKLYTTGKQAASQAAKSLSQPVPVFVYFGELAGNAQGHRHDCHDKLVYSHQSALDYMSRVANDPTGQPIATDGVAWHAYQDVSRPNDPRKDGKIGIGRIMKMKGRIAALATTGRLNDGSGNTPPLLITEFGYHNQTVAHKKGNERPGYGAHSEKTEMSWYPEALTKARNNGAKAFFFYEIINEPTNPKFDTGTVVDTRPFNPLGDPVSAFGRVVGPRKYGVGPPDQPLMAYCAIVRWAAHRGYRVSYRFNPEPDKTQDCATHLKAP